MNIPEDMQHWGGLYLPAHETHLIAWMKAKNVVVEGKQAYQYHKIVAALAMVKQFRTAIDVGGHCGLWSMHLAKRFDWVHAFEPVELHRRCFVRNVAGSNYSLHAMALGDKAGSVKMQTTLSSSGDTWVRGEGPIPMQRLDEVSFTIDDAEYSAEVDFIKLDCEGFELFALKGGEELLKRYRPVVCVEQKPGRAQKFGVGEKEAVDYLISLGAVLRKEMSGDFLMDWPS